MKQLLLLLCCVPFFGTAQLLDDYFPPTDSDEWQTMTPAELGWCEENIDTLINYLEDRNTKAFIVLYKGRIVIEQYFDSFTQDSLWVWNSAGKTVTAFSVGMAQQQGLLSLADPASDYLGEGWTSLTPEQESAIKVRHQLEMTSGLNDFVLDPYCTDPECLEFQDEPGERWAYHNAPYTLLTDVIENASGTGINLFVYDAFGEAIGFNGLYIPFGFNRIFVSKAREMARFGLFMQHNGSWDGNQIMTDQTFFEQMITPSQEINESYGYLWWLNGQPSYMLPGLQLEIPFELVPDAPDDLVAGIGKDAQLLHVVNSEDIVLVRMGNAPDDSLVPIDINNDIWQLMNDILCGANSIEESAEEALVFGPNPATDEIRFTHAANWSIWNISGQKVLQGSGSRADLQDLSPGSYVVRWNGQTGRLIVQ